MPISREPRMRSCGIWVMICPAPAGWVGADVWAMAVPAIRAVAEGPAPIFFLSFSPPLLMDTPQRRLEDQRGSRAGVQEDMSWAPDFGRAKPSLADPCFRPKGDLARSFRGGTGF